MWSARLGFDAEEPRQEIFYVRRQGDEQVGFLFALHRLGARGNQPVMERGVDFANETEERGIDAQQPCALV